jgi:rubrerythrin
MLPLEEIARIKTEIERLEQLCGECTDSGIQKLIEDLIKAEKKKLEPAKSKPWQL